MSRYVCLYINPRPKPKSIGSIMAGFKSAVTKWVNEYRQGGNISLGFKIVGVQNFEPLQRRRRQNKYPKIIPIHWRYKMISPQYRYLHRFRLATQLLLMITGTKPRRGDPPVAPTPAGRPYRRGTHRPRVVSGIPSSTTPKIGPREISFLKSKTPAGLAKR